MKEKGPLGYRIKFLVLALLALKPSHGYELSRRIEEITKGLVKGGPGSIYPVLRDLKDEGLIEEDLIVEQGRAKKIYRITAKGASLLISYIDLFYEMANTFIDYAVKAREKLQKIISGAAETIPPCPDEETIRRIEAMEEKIKRYLDNLKEKAMSCKERR